MHLILNSNDYKISFLFGRISFSYSSWDNTMHQDVAELRVWFKNVNTFHLFLCVMFLHTQVVFFNLYIGSQRLSTNFKKTHKNT